MEIQSNPVLSEIIFESGRLIDAVGSDAFLQANQYLLCDMVVLVYFLIQQRKLDRKRHEDHKQQICRQPEPVAFMVFLILHHECGRKYNQQKFYFKIG